MAGCGGGTTRPADGGRSTSTNPTLYSFASAYERHRAEDYVNETVLGKEMSSKEPNPESNEPELENTVEIKSTRCVLATPGPYVTRMTCTVLVGIHELHPANKTAQQKKWLVDVRIDPRTSVLSLDAKKENTSA
jgi:hypothetical protein